MKIKISWRTLLCAAAMMIAAAPAIAQDGKKFEVTPSADLVSSYVWRGVYTAGASFQPGVTLSYAGLSLGAWGSTDFLDGGTNEFDIALGYSFGNVSLGVTDYWWRGRDAFYTDKGSHLYEATIGYGIGNLSLQWNTFFAGDDDKEVLERDANENPLKYGDNQFSTYVEASYAFDVQGVTLTPTVGISPWTGIYHGADKTGFGFSQLSLTASKSLKITDSFSLPVFAQAIYSPTTEKAFMVFGINF
ncbi:hypothetical protein Barb4_02833 [Bacteroidales bacterium Barb4]|nr:hypothetical protein Barb4_02833 [Bacteroidales bacterium Barb4]